MMRLSSITLTTGLLMSVATAQGQTRDRIISSAYCAKHFEILIQKVQNIRTQYSADLCKYQPSEFPEVKKIQVEGCKSQQQNDEEALNNYNRYRSYVLHILTQTLLQGRADVIFDIKFGEKRTIDDWNACSSGDNHPYNDCMTTHNYDDSACKSLLPMACSRLRRCESDNTQF